jgi:hypothetical protein
MRKTRIFIRRLALALLAVGLSIVGKVANARMQSAKLSAQQASSQSAPLQPTAPREAVIEAQQSATVSNERPEQQKTEHDRSNLFDAQNDKPSSPVFQTQPKAGKHSGFDFYRYPLNSERLFADPNEIVRQLSAEKPRVMDTQRRLFEGRYNLQPKLDPEVKMSRGKLFTSWPNGAVGARHDMGTACLAKCDR